MVNTIHVSMVRRFGNQEVNKFIHFILFVHKSIQNTQVQQKTSKTEQDSKAH